MIPPDTDEDTISSTHHALLQRKFHENKKKGKEFMPLFNEWQEKFNAARIAYYANNRSEIQHRTSEKVAKADVAYAKVAAGVEKQFRKMQGEALNKARDAQEKSTENEALKTENEALKSELAALKIAYETQKEEIGVLKALVEEYEAFSQSQEA